MSWGHQQTILVTSNFFCGPSGIRQKGKKKMSSLQSSVGTFSFSKSLKASSLKVLCSNLKAHKRKEGKILESTLVSNAGHYRGLLIMRRNKRLSWYHFTTIPGADNKSMTDPRPSPGLCTGDRQNMGKCPPPEEVVPRGPGMLSSPQLSVMVFGGKGSWQLRSVTFKMDRLHRKECLLFFQFGRKRLCVYNL